jgi:hypothetical protein
VEAAFGAQVPAPSHAGGGVKLDPVQLAFPHVVPLTHLRQPPVPSQEPSRPQVLAAAAAHWPVGAAVPAGIGVQVPGVPVRLHDIQVPVQALLQQTPWAQNPVPHSVPVPQAAPGGLRPQLMLTHWFGDTQSVLVEQVVLQAVALHMNGAQLALVTVRQVPAPSQVRAGVSVVPAQLAAAHCVPAATWRHFPAPSHVPSLPQTFVVVAHWLAGVGAAPAATGVQVPVEPVRLHAWQVPVQAVLQQTPCAQLPEVHSEPAPQVTPFDFFWQVFVMQK